jgi:hypothetical protein
MKRTGKRDAVLAVALTWDGARHPTRSLPPKARAFLAGKSRGATVPSRANVAALFAVDHVKEIRVCWVPKLRGGDDVLSGPFPAPSAKRLRFQTARTLHFGDVLGVVYRRIA